MNASGTNSPLDQVRGKAAEARLRVLELDEEAARLEQRGQLELQAALATSRIPQSPAEKVALFLDLFGDVSIRVSEALGKRQNREERIRAWPPTAWLYRSARQLAGTCTISYRVAGEVTLPSSHTTGRTVHVSGGS